MRSSLRASTLLRNATPLWPDAILESLHESSPGSEDSFGRRTVDSTPRYNTDDQPENDLVSMLRQRVDQLEHELDSRNNPAEIDRIRQEWQTSEELLQQSQRDNALKHETIEQYKVYVKEIERLCSTMIGPDWKVEHDSRSPFGQSTGFSASTPLPKPSASSLRRSTSLISPSKRNSRSVNRHASTSGFSQFTLNPLPSTLVTNPTIDDTPTGAMRKLMGSGPQPTTNHNKNQAAPRGPYLSTLEPAAQSSHIAVLPTPSAHIDHELSAPTLQRIEGLLVNIAGRNDSPRNPGFAALFEQSKMFILESEQRAEAREKRLVKMLEEARSHASPAYRSGPE